MSNEITQISASGLSSYQVLIGRSLLHEVDDVLGPLAKKVLLVYPEALEVSAEALADELRSHGREVWQFPVANGEDAKTDQWLFAAWSYLGQAEFSRSDIVLSLGGGTVTDLAGFIAATWLRGIQVVHIPTTLLAMVDAAIGGKTGINTLEGKNLVGAFYDPKTVLVDLDCLDALPKVELASGFAEIVKCGFISDPQILNLISTEPTESVNPQSDVFRELVTRAIEVKVSIVSNDFRESGNREFLNFGHTLGHAIELVEHFKIKHGHAVAIGMCFAAELGRLSGRTNDQLADSIRNTLDALGLPTKYKRENWSALYKAMKIDKKSRGGMLRFIILDELAKPAVLEAPTEEILYQAFLEITD